MFKVLTDVVTDENIPINVYFDPRGRGVGIEVIEHRPGHPVRADIYVEVKDGKLRVILSRTPEAVLGTEDVEIIEVTDLKEEK